MGRVFEPKTLRIPTRLEWVDTWKNPDVEGCSYDIYLREIGDVEWAAVSDYVDKLEVVHITGVGDPDTESYIKPLNLVPLHDEGGKPFPVQLSHEILFICVALEWGQRSGPELPEPFGWQEILHAMHDPVLKLQILQSHIKLNQGARLEIDKAKKKQLETNRKRKANGGVEVAGSDDDPNSEAPVTS